MYAAPMPLPQKLTPRQEAEQAPYALAARATAAAQGLRSGQVVLNMVAGKAQVSQPESATAPPEAAMKDSAPVCAVAVVVDSSGNVLTVTQEDGSLALPGGWLMDGEDPELAAARECREETGFPASPVRLLYVAPDEDGNVVAAVECQLQGNQGVPDRGEQGQVSWMPLADLIRGTKYKGYNSAVFDALNDDVEKAKNKPHVVEEHRPDGSIVAHHFDSKGAAYDAGMSMRRGGKVAFMHPKDSPFRVTSDTHLASGGGEEHRDDHGRFSKATGALDGDALEAGGRLVPDQGPEAGTINESDPMRDAHAREEKAMSQEQAWRKVATMAAGGEPSSLNDALTSTTRKDWAKWKQDHPYEAKPRAAGAGKQPEGGEKKPGEGEKPEAGGEKKPDAQNPKQASSLWRAAGGASKLQAALGKAVGATIDKIKAAPGAIKHAVMHEIGLVKNAGLALKNVATGKPVTSQQKGAVKQLAVKVGVKLAFVALGAALPGIGHVVGIALEKVAPHAIEALAHHIAHHAAEHVVEHLVEHTAEHNFGVTFKMAGIVFKADDSADSDTTAGAEKFTNYLFAGIQDSIQNMKEADWDQVMWAGGGGSADDDGSSDETDDGSADDTDAAPAPKGKKPAPAPAPAAAPPTKTKKDGTPQIPGPDERVGGQAPGTGYTVRVDTPVGYGVAKDVARRPGEGLLEYNKRLQAHYGTAKGADGKVLKKINFQGIPVHIDRPVGFVQKGKDADGNEWSRTYKADYGFIPGTQGGDGAGLDVFVGPKDRAPDAFWATQVDKDGQFDEYKVLLGFENAQDAEKTYKDHIPAQYLKALKPVPVPYIRALLGLEPIEVMKALLADSLENMFAADELLEEVQKASVHVDSHSRESGSKVREHDRRAPLSGEDAAPKPPKEDHSPKGHSSPKGGPLRGASGKPVHALRQLVGVHDTRSALHAVGSIVGGIIENRVAAAHAKAKASSAAAEKASKDREKAESDRDKGERSEEKTAQDQQKTVNAAAEEAKAHGQAAADHYDAARRAEDSGDQKLMDFHDEAAAKHAEASNKIAAAVDAARKGDDPKAMDDMKSALKEGAAHSKKYAQEPKSAPAKDEPKNEPKGASGDEIKDRIASGKPGPVGEGHSDVHSWVTIDGHAVPITDGGVGPKAKASDEMLSQDSMTKPFVPVIPAAEGDGHPDGEGGIDWTRKAEVEIVQKADDAAVPEERYVLGIVLKPEDVDSQGDVYSASEIAKTARRWMSDFRNIDLQHKVLINHLVEPVESYIAPCDMQIGKRLVKQGTWLLAVHAKDDDVWNEIKTGKLTGFSISGLARKTPVPQL